MRRTISSGRRLRLILPALLGGVLSGCLIHSAHRPSHDQHSHGVTTSRPVTSIAATTQADPVLDRIRDEGLRRSQAPATIDYLCNVIGPRLTASPGMHKAAEWTRDTLAGWGLANAHLETWGPFGRGWSVRRFSIQIIEPTAFVPSAYPRAWSPGLAEQPLEAEVIYVDATTEAGLAKYKGKLKGKIVLLGQIREPELPLAAPATRHSDEYLTKLAASRPSDSPSGSTTSTVTPSSSLISRARAIAQGGRRDSLRHRRRIADRFPAANGWSGDRTFHPPDTLGNQCAQDAAAGRVGDRGFQPAGADRKARHPDQAPRRPAGRVP